MYGSHAQYVSGTRQYVKAGTQSVMKNKGFSLVELIIVIAIMAVLIGVLAPVMIKYVEKGKEAKDISNLDTCVESVKTFYTDKADHPTVVIVTGTKGTAFVGDDTYNSVANAALVDTKSDNCLITGTWTTQLKAIIDFPDGKVTYDGESKYYTLNADKTEFVAK